MCLNKIERRNNDYVHIPVHMPAGECVCAANRAVGLHVLLTASGKSICAAVRMPVSHTGRPPVSPSPLQSALSLSD